MNRRGVASIWALVMLAVATVMSFAILGRMAAAQKAADRNVIVSQANCLADAAVEHAKKQNADYRGETLKLLPNSEVIIAADRSVTVRYPLDRKPVTITRPPAAGSSGPATPR